MSPLLSLRAAYRRLYLTAGPARGNAASWTPKFQVGLLERGLVHLLGHAAIGAAVGWGVLAALIETDAGGLGSLLAEAEDGPVVLVLLSLQFGAGFATFAAVTSMAMTELGADQ